MKQEISETQKADAANARHHASQHARHHVVLLISLAKAQEESEQSAQEISEVQKADAVNARHHASQHARHHAVLLISLAKETDFLKRKNIMVSRSQLTSALLT